MTLLLIIVGYILEHNSKWFNGAHTVGEVLLIVGIVAFVFEVLIWVFVVGVGVAAVKTSGTPSRKARGRRGF